MPPNRHFAKLAGVRDWVHTFGLYKWAWAGHVPRRSAQVWLWKVTSWRDSEWTQTSLESGALRPLRPSRRRWMKWEHVLQRFARRSGLGSWMLLACAKEQWLLHQSDFAEFICSSVCADAADDF